LTGKEDIISAKIFVGNLSYDTTQEDLERLFSEVGHVVEMTLPLDRITGRAKGFGFVEFTEEVAAAEAIERFDGHQLHGRSLRVSQAEERQRRTPNYSDAGPSRKHRGSRGSKPKGSRRNLRAKKRGF
jgi:cold-inducible RNA-binding protein